MTASVDQDQPIVRLQRFDIAGLEPRLQAISEPVLEHEGLPLALNPVMNSDALVDRIWHLRRLPLPLLRMTHHIIRRCG
jgi:hypothetical protein